MKADLGGGDEERGERKNRLAGYAPSGRDGILSLTKNEVYLTSCPVRV